MVASPFRPERLRALLDASVGRRDVSADRARDPVGLLHAFRDPADREVAGVVAAALAFGRVETILRDVRAVLGTMGGSPRGYALDFRRGRDAPFFRRFVHRWTTGAHLSELFLRLRRVLEHRGTLGDVFRGGIARDDGDSAGGLAALARALRAGPRPSRALRALWPSPEEGSACKRPCLYARWMVRSGDGVDPGGPSAWARVQRRLLLLPLDAHVSRIAFFLGLTDRRGASLAAARQATARLRLLDPVDPLRYDFALCHLGISGDCPSRRDPAICEACELKSECRMWREDATRRGVA
ncbi:MAG: DUF2400 domain-containing protein [Planctomycetales bacterium]|nr:DUF2400 domain-containing protein [Planctomycetales bacterium]